MKYVIAMALYVVSFLLGRHFGLGWWESMGVVLLGALAAKFEASAIEGSRKRKEGA